MRKRRRNPLGQLDPISAGLMAVTGAIGIGSQIYAGSKEDAARKKAIQKQKTDAKYAARAEQLALMAAQNQQQQQAILAAAQQKRQEQQTLMMAIGGIAAGVSMLFLWAAVSKKK